MRIQEETFTFAQSSAFIVFEGVNGAGKSTLLKRAAEFLRAEGAPCIETREPGGTELGKILRSVVQERPELTMSPVSELFLFAADRHEHVVKCISPALKRGEWVLSDRYFYSTLAFQGHGRGVSIPLIEEIMRIAIDGVRPDLVVLVDLDPEEGLKRISKRREAQLDRFEKEELAFHHRIRDGFLQIADTSPDSFLVLDGKCTPDELFSRLATILGRKRTNG